MIMLHILYIYICYLYIIYDRYTVTTFKYTDFCINIRHFRLPLGRFSLARPAI
jgi:hypothetical protein